MTSPATAAAAAAEISGPGKRLKDLQPEVRDRDHWGPYIEEHASGRCDCGTLVVLDADWVECDGCCTRYDRNGDEI